MWFIRLKRLVQLGREIHGPALVDKMASGSCRFRDWLPRTVCGHRVDYLATILSCQSRRDDPMSAQGGANASFTSVCATLG
jgi:hypothetical protein